MWPWSAGCCRALPEGRATRDVGEHDSAVDLGRGGATDGGTARPDDLAVLGDGRPLGRDKAAACRAVRCAPAEAGVPKVCGSRVGRRCRLASTLEIVPGAEADVPQLFALAKDTFAGLPGWSDERVLETLRRDVVFVAR